jgi:hypothetical protein
MSIDGVVRCRCLEEGRASPPPCPVEVMEAWTQPTSDHRDESNAVFEWAATACPHPQFWLVEHKVRRTALLKAAEARGGRAAFPAIYATLPMGSGGEATPVDSADCLAELDALRELMHSGRMLVIVDCDTGAVVHVGEDGELVSLSHDSYLPPGLPRIISFGRDYEIIASPPIDRPITAAWLGRDGVVRLRDSRGTVLWQAREFTQTADDDHWVFRDVLSGREARHRSPIPPGPCDARPLRLRAEFQSYDSDVALSGVAELRTLFETSVRTGRSVFWV